MTLKNKFPFRLGTSSYIIPDDIIPNIKFLADKVDDVEILLFESDEISNLPDSNTIKEMKRIAENNQLTYNIHLPIDIALGSVNETVRKKSLQKCLRVIDLTEPVNPLAYILHLTGNSNIMGTATSETVTDWLPALRKSLSEISKANINTNKICIETLKYPFYYIDNLLNEFNLSVCLDIGHIQLYNHPLEEYIKKYLDKTKVIHLHGVYNGKDHLDISNLSHKILDYIIQILKKNKMTNRILTLEVFNETDLNTSLNLLGKYTDE